MKLKSEVGMARGPVLHQLKTKLSSIET